MSKQIKFDIDARESILRGVETVAEIASTTLGPRGCNVMIDLGNGRIHTTKDGVSTIRSLELEDPFENMGAQTLKQVALKMEEIGDGTTSSIVLASAIYREGLKHITAGCSPLALKRGIDIAIENIIKVVEGSSKAVQSTEELYHIAKISTNGDDELATIITDAVETVGKDGVISIQKSNTSDTTLETVEGMELNGSGYHSPYFSTDPSKLTVEFDNPFILMYNDTIENLQELVPILQAVTNTKRSLVIIGEVEGEALSTLLVNRINNTISVCSCKSPSYGENKTKTLEDVAKLTGGTVFKKEMGVKLSEITVDDLGSADRVVVDKDKTTIIGGHGDTDAIQKHIDVLRTQIEDASTPLETKQLTNRLSRLSGGVCIIKVGAYSEGELAEKWDRIDDAVASTRSANNTGIVLGGGTALLRASKLVDIDPLEHDEQMGVSIVLRAVEAPLRKIVSNGGDDDGVVVRDILVSESENFGYDALKREYVDMYTSGIIDPTQVVVSAIQNAGSIASLLLTTKCMITDIPTDTPPPMGGMDGMGGMM